MARRTVIRVYDDIDDTEITEDGESRTFAVAGVEYELDLTKKHADKFDRQMKEWMAHAQRKGRIQRAEPSAKQTSSEYLAEVREWARKNGFDVSDRGRVPKRILDAFRAPVTFTG